MQIITKTIKLNDEFYLRIELDNWILGVSLEPSHFYRVMKELSESMSKVYAELGKHLLPDLQEFSERLKELSK